MSPQDDTLPLDTRCIHDIYPPHCGACKKLHESTTSRRPKRRTRKARRSPESENTVVCDESYAVARTQDGQAKSDFLHITDATKTVHIHGFPNLWAIKLILERSANLETITVIPSHFQKLGKRHRALCAARDVTIRAGYYRPANAWQDNECRSSHYRTQKAFMQSLAGQQKELFRELLRFGFTCAKMAARYFCLNGEEFANQEEIGVQFGYARENQSAQNSVSRRVNAVLRYLDPEMEVGADAMRIVATMTTQVAHFRALAKNELEMQRLLQRLGIKQLPEGMPMAKLPVLEALLLAEKTGRLAEFGKQAPRRHRLLRLRYGLEDGKWYTLRALPQKLGLTHGRMYQLEISALEELGIQTN